MSVRSRHSRLLIPSIAAVFALIATSVFAQVEHPHVFSFDIPAEPLADALVAVANRTNLNILVDRKLVGDRRAAALKDDLTAGQALTRLLEGTGLKYSFLNEHTIALATDDPLLQKTAINLEEVIVTGSRIALTANQQAQPVQIYTREEMERSGQTTVGDFLNTLPQVSIPSVPTAFQAYASLRSVRLHGLPFGTTLVLIDGQRTEGGYTFFDLNSIPAAAIERIEILPVGSSAIYGSDALAGVVNIVMKKNFEGLAADVQYGGASGLRDGTVDAAFGKKWDRGSISLVVSEQRQSELAMSERLLTATQDFTPYGGKNYQVDSCDPANAYASNGQVLSNGGQVRKCGPYRSESLLPATQQTSAVLAGHYQVTDWLDLFTSVLYSHFVSDFYSNNLLTLSGGSSGSYVAAATNPYNPYGQNVGVSWGYGRADSRRVENMERPLVGIRGDLPGDWHWELTGLYSHDNFAFPSYSINAPAVQAALASSNPATALNVFTNGMPASQQLLSSLYTRTLQSFDEGVAEAQAIVRGPVVSLPAGPLQTAFGATYDHFRLWNQITSNGTYIAPIARSRDAYAAFAETRAPLLGGTSRVSGAETLAWSLAGRYDHSDDFGGKATWQTGLEWRPLESLLLRGAYGTAYRAPLLSQVYGGLSVISSAPITDPLRGGAAYTVPFTVGTNTNVQPETGSSRSLGLVYSGHDVPGLESSLTWWNIRYNNYISAANYQDLVSYPGSFPSGLVVRATPTAQDTANGYAGVITAVNSIYVNFGSIEASGIDFETHYAIRTSSGTWTPSLALTETYQYQVALRPGQPVQSYVSQASNTLGFSPRWKGNLGLGWDKGPWSASVTGRYLGSYRDYVPYAPAGYELGNYWVFDTNIRYSLGKLLGTDVKLQDSYVSLGVVNLFDRQPQFSYYVLGYDYQEADIRGRFISLQAGVKF